MKLIEDDCLKALAAMPENSVDSVVCDPPYSLAFMGRAWDKHDTPLAFQEWCHSWAMECYRVLKPGGHLLAFGGSRTYHRLAAGIEDAGFDVRDQLMWVYGQGFPKSHNLPGGMGTALKPAHEPIALARKPFTGTVAANVEEFGTGALNIDGCRVSYEDGGSTASNPSLRRSVKGGNGGHIIATETQSREMIPHTDGRWPANLLLDDEAAAVLDAQTGERPSTGTPNRPAVPGLTDSGGYGEWAGAGVQGPLYSDTGGASRFFYAAKANKAERSAGLTTLLPNDRFRTRRCLECDKNVPEPGACGCDADIEWVEAKPTKNSHPTVKPIDLMRWLVRLVTPPGGVICDPFAGSGTTGIAAGLEGFDFIGIEREAEYAEIARTRLAWWAEREGDTADILKRAGLAVKLHDKHAKLGQLQLPQGAKNE